MTVQRADYLAGKVSHQDYYRQFVTPEICKLVVDRFGRKRLTEALLADPHLNSIPLRQWDMLVVTLYVFMGDEIKRKMALSGDYWSQAGGVCILKEAARLEVQP